MPVTVTGLSGVVAISAGYFHNLALLNDGTLRAWGANTLGQVGNGTQIDSPVPVTVTGLTGVTRIAAGNSHSLAIINPVVSLPTSLSFGGVNVGSSVSHMVTIQNSGGANAADFSVTGPPLPVSLAPGSSTSVTVSFTPLVSGARAATLRVLSTGFGSPHNVALTGTGINTTAPTMGFGVSPPANANGWHRGPVTATLSASDPESAITSQTGCGTFTLTAQTSAAGTVLTCTAISAGGTASISGTIRIDLTPPAIIAPPAVSAVSASGSPVVVSDATLGSATATDALSGIAGAIVRTGVPAGNLFPPGQTTVTYTVFDRAGNSSTATQIVTIRRPPIATPQTVNVISGVPKTFTLQASDPDGSALTFSIVTAPVQGTVTFNNAAKQATYTPNPLSSGTDTFVYRATDVDGLSAQATVTLRYLNDLTYQMTQVSNTASYEGGGLCAPNKVLRVNGLWRNDSGASQVDVEMVVTVLNGATVVASTVNQTADGVISPLESFSTQARLRITTCLPGSGPGYSVAIYGRTP